MVKAMSGIATKLMSISLCAFDSTGNNTDDLKSKLEHAKSGTNKLQIINGSVKQPFSKVQDFLSKYVFGKEVGDPVPDVMFAVGTLPQSTIDKISQFIDGFGEGNAEVKVSGRSLKHSDEQRHDLFSSVVSKYPDIISNLDIEVLLNPNRWVVHF